MRAVVQRVRSARVEVEVEVQSPESDEPGRIEITGSIDEGLLVLLGVMKDDGKPEQELLAEKIAQMRIFEDELGKMNRSLLDINGEVLVVSQFTLAADCRKGRRPSFNDAAPPAEAVPLYEGFCEHLRKLGIKKVATGRFAAMMAVHLVNWGPVTIILDSRDLMAPRRS